jgi:hypothetical protein
VTVAAEQLCNGQAAERHSGLNHQAETSICNGDAKRRREQQ